MKPQSEKGHETRQSKEDIIIKYTAFNTITGINYRCTDTFEYSNEIKKIMMRSLTLNEIKDMLGL